MVYSISFTMYVGTLLAFLPLIASGYLLNGNVSTTAHGLHPSPPNITQGAVATNGATKYDDTASNGPTNHYSPTTPVLLYFTNLPVTLQGNSSASSSTQLCADTLDTCSQYGKAPCTDKTYEAWARAHCPLYCGFCTPQVPVTQLCENKISNCAEYDSGNLCTADSYYTWAYDNCRAYCKFDICDGTDNRCEDSKDSNCPLLNATSNLCSDIEKAKTTCRKYCDLCNGTDGEWCPWGSWSSCGVTCGNGTQVKTRQCACPAPANGGNDCAGPPDITKTCSIDSCPVHGGWSDWSDWGSCSTSCGIGLKIRDRQCNNPYPPMNGNHCFGESMNYRVCAEAKCSSGNWTSWGEWSECGKSCLRRRERNCTVTSLLLQSCAGDTFENEICSSNSCLVDGGWSAWSSWSDCSGECGVTSLKKRTRTCTNPTPSLLGHTCTGNSEDKTLCYSDSCPADGNWCSWGSWGSCDTNCGVATQERSRQCACPAPERGGKDCAGISRSDLHIRLDGGSGSNSGRVEVSLDGSAWGRVCDDIFDNNNNGAKVVCRMLGLPTINARYDTGVLDGTGPIFLDEVNCTGREESLLSCSHNTWGDENCFDYEAVGVVCD